MTPFKVTPGRKLGLHIETTNHDDTLIPCPFCHTPYAAQPLRLDDSGFIPRFTVICSACRAQGPIKYSEMEAIEAWNFRGN